MNTHHVGDHSQIHACTEYRYSRPSITLEMDFEI